MSWHPEDPRSWGGWHPPGPPLGPPSAHLGLGPPWSAAVRQPARPPAAYGRPASSRPAQHGRGHRPVPAQPGHAVGLGRRPSIAPGDRSAWWKLALASLATIAAVILVEGGPGPAPGPPLLRLRRWLRQFGAPVIPPAHAGAFLWPQLPLAVPVGLLAAALNLAGRRRAIDGRGPQATARRHPPHGLGRAPSRGRA